MGNNFLEEFISKFQSLSDKEKFALGQEFRQKTGGTLSAYSNPLPVVVGLIPFYTEEGEKILAVKRGIQPFIGELALPGGFQELGETGMEATSREIFEEVGIKTDPNKFEVFGNPLLADNKNQIIFFKYTETLSADILKDFKPNHETQGVELVDHSKQLCFPTHQEKMNDFFGVKYETKSKPKF